MLQTFGIGSVAQTVLSRGENGTFFTINFCWGIGVTLGIYWAGGISGEELSSVLSLAPSTLIRFQTKTELFCSVSKKIFVHTYRFRIVFVSFRQSTLHFKRCYTLIAHAQMNSTHAHFNISAREIELIPRGCI